jgi:hypothetical protein
MEKKRVYVTWHDPHSYADGWHELKDYSTEPLTIESFGVIVFENEQVICIAGNYSAKTEEVSALVSTSKNM